MDSASSTSSDEMPPPPPRPPKSSQPISQSAPSSGFERMGRPLLSPITLSVTPEMVVSEENSSSDTLHILQIPPDVDCPSGVPKAEEVDGGFSEINLEECLKRDQKDDANIKSEPDMKSNDLYCIPPWGTAPAFPFSLEVIKDGLIIDTLSVSSKSAYMFGRSDRCDFILEHPSISRYHAVLQFKRNGDAYIYDLGSTHGTIINKKQVLGKTYTPLHVGDVFRFGLSSRLYVLQGPVELMPKESLTRAERQVLREVQIANDQADQQASLLRGKRESIQMEGATWGMMEDAYEDNIKEEDEVTWQTYSGQLTEKQQKTLQKIQKRNEKLARLQKEIDSIQVKEVPQGGLTQGQQTQIMRNEQRIEQLMEELENLEETLNQSIQESIGARVKRGLLGMKVDENEDELSDDDEFYDRTKWEHKKHSNAEASGPTVETAESLLEKREKIIADINKLSEMLKSEEESNVIGNEVCPEQTIVESQDPLDAFMTTVSSNLVRDHASIIIKEREKQQIELDRVCFLLKIADPTGEASRNWHPEQLTKPVQPVKQASEQMPKGDLNATICQFQENTSSKAKSIKDSENKITSTPSHVDGQVAKGEPKVTKGVWLGHARENTVEKVTATDVEENSNDKDFLEYKERHRMSLKPDLHDRVHGIPEDAGGLILRTPKIISKEGTHGKSQEDEKTVWEGAAAAAAKTEAVVSRHQNRLVAAEEEIQDVQEDKLPNRLKKRKLGPEKPAFLNIQEEGVFQSWLPPEGQTGDGRTALNDKYGY